MRKQKCLERGTVHICTPGMGSFPKHSALKMHVLGPSRCQNSPRSEANTVGAGGVMGDGERWGEAGGLATPCHCPCGLLPWRLRLPLQGCRFPAPHTHPGLEPGTYLQLLLGVGSSSWFLRQPCSFQSAALNTGHMSNLYKGWMSSIQRSHSNTSAQGLLCGRSSQ